MFHSTVRARVLAVTIAGTLALGTISLAASASADDSGAVDVTVTVVGALPAGPVNVQVDLPVGSNAQSTPVVVRVAGLKPFSHVEVWVHSTPYLLASGTADAAGNFEASGFLPVGLEIGGHTVTVEGVSAAGEPFSQDVASFAIIDGGTIGSATTSSTNGVLSLVLPAAAVAEFDAPTLVGNRSTTVGTLGRVVVADGRILSREGWTLSAGVADFVNPADGSVIASSQLGVMPQLVSTDALGIGLFPPQVAGTASYPMNLAFGSPLEPVGTTVLDAALTFVAPPEASVGTYESTVSLTLVSQ